MTVKRTLSNFFRYSIIIVALTSCVTDFENRPKQTIGKLLGAGVGGLVGSQIGSGKGQLAAVAAGVLAGAYFGDEIGSSLDRADKLFMDKTAKKSLEYSQTGVVSSWKNPDSGNSGTFKPINTFATRDGINCRQFETTIFIDGNKQTATGTACRSEDGTWKITS